MTVEMAMRLATLLPKVAEAVVALEELAETLR